MERNISLLDGGVKNTLISGQQFLRKEIGRIEKSYLLGCLRGFIFLAGFLGGFL